MAAGMLLLIVALCGVYVVVRAETVDSNSGLARERPPQVVPAETGDNPPDDDSSTTTASTPGSSSTGTPPPGSNSTIPGTNATKSGNGTMPPTTGTTPPTNGTKPPTNGTKSSTTGTKPPTTGTKPPTTGTKPPTTGTEPPTTGTEPSTTESTPSTTSTNPPTASINPPSNPPSPRSNIPFQPIPPNGWLYPGLLFPPSPQSSYSSSDFFDSQRSDKYGEVLIEDFEETITIRKRTMIKQNDKYEEEKSDMSQSDSKEYGNDNYLF